MGKQCIIKERFEKKYRLSELDKKITKQRMLNESRSIARSSKCGINVPTIYFVDMVNRKIYLQAISNSCQLKEILKVIDEATFGGFISNYNSLIEKIILSLGELLSKLHNADIIHGDLTPSNILLKINMNNIQPDYSFNSGKEVILSKVDYDFMYLIDFGLSGFSNSVASAIEDKAVDLYLLKRAIVSSNPKSQEIVSIILPLYNIIIISYLV